MKGFLRNLLASLALACALLPVFAGTAWADKVDVSLSALSAEGELTGGCVGFSPDERFRFAHSSLDDRESFTVYAVPDEGYEFVMWVHIDAQMTVVSTSPTFTVTVLPLTSTAGTCFSNAPSVVLGVSSIIGLPQHVRP